MCPIDLSQGQSYEGSFSMKCQSSQMAPVCLQLTKQQPSRDLLRKHHVLPAGEMCHSIINILKS